MEPDDYQEEWDLFVTDRGAWLAKMRAAGVELLLPCEETKEIPKSVEKPLRNLIRM